MAAKTLISAQELKELTSVRIFDCRFTLMDHEVGQRAYFQAHIPHASYLHLNNDLSGEIVPGKTGRHPLPDRDQFIRRVQHWGIEEDSQLVAYDADNGAFAARFWWMMRWLGHANIAVLDGGFQAWQAAGYDVDSLVPDYSPSNFEPKPALTKTISAEEIPASPYHITDARELARFKGEVEPVDPVAGHIPSASCLPFANNLTESKQFKPLAALKSQFTDAGVSTTAPTICYCGSGVTAAHNILALVHSGFPEPILYPGSWSEWITDTNRPVSRNA